MSDPTLERRPERRSPDHLSLEQMQGYQSRSLAPRALLAVDRHLGGCSSCRRSLLSRMGSIALPEEVRDMPEPLHLSYEQIAAYVDGGLAESEKERVDAHTFICTSCSRELRDLQRLELRLTDSPAESFAAQPVPESVPWLERLAAFFTAPGRAREFGLALAAIIAGVFVMLRANRRAAAGDLGHGSAATLIQLGASAHPAYALGGMLLIAGGVLYLLRSAVRKK